MKKLMCTILVSSFMLASGCSGTEKEDVAAKPIEAKAGPRVSTLEALEGIVEYGIINNAASLPPSFQTIIEDHKERRGFYSSKIQEGEILLLISLGRKSTKGHGIAITSVKDIGDIVQVTVKEIAPTAESALPKVVTYPYVIARVTGVDRGDHLEVVNAEGRKFHSF